MGCDARRDNPAPFPDLYLGRDTEVFAIDCKNLGWTVHWSECGDTQKGPVMKLKWRPGRLAAAALSSRGPCLV